MKDKSYIRIACIVLSHQPEEPYTKAIYWVRNLFVFLFYSLFFSVLHPDQIANLENTIINNTPIWNVLDGFRPIKMVWDITTRGLQHAKLPMSLRYCHIRSVSFNFALVDAALHQDVALLPPSGSPRVTNDPVVDSVERAPPDDNNAVIDRHGVASWIGVDTTPVKENSVWED